MAMKKKTWIGLSAALMLICTIIFGSTPVAAAGNALIPVKQVFTIGTAANPSAVSGVYTYTLTADNASFPMPSGSSGGVYTFTMDGNQELNVGPITTYTAAGLYTYKLRGIIGSAVGYTYDHTVYDVLVYVSDHAGALQTAVFIKKNGTKCAKAEFDPTYSDPPATPSSPSTPPLSSSGSGSGVPTGDNSHIVLWGSVFVATVLLLGIDLFILWKNRKKKEEEAMRTSGPGKHAADR